MEGARGKRKTIKPDGGWGWFVVLGVAISNMTTQSMLSVFGLLFMRRLPELGIDTSGVSLIVSVQSAVLNLSGLVTGPVLKKFTPRQLAATGAFLVFFGLLLTGYANSLLTFICSYSTLTGLGIGFLYPSTFVAINSYFDRWRSRAVGLAMTGTGLGQMLLPLLVRYLLDEYNFRGTVLILSAVSAHALVGASLYQPVSRHVKLTPEEEIWEDDQFEVCEPLKTKRRFLSRIFHAMDWDLLKDLPFLSLIMGLAMVYTANVFFQALLPFFLESVGYPRGNIAVCLSVMSGADILGRLILPSITDVFKLRTKTVFFLGAGLSALARSGLVWYNQSISELYPTLALSAVCGFVRSAIVCNFNLCVSDQTTPERLPSALGLHMVFKGLSVFAFGPLIGVIRVQTDSYSFAVHLLSVAFLGLPFLSWLTEFVALKRGRR